MLIRNSFTSIADAQTDLPSYKSDGVLSPFSFNAFTVSSANLSNVVALPQLCCHVPRAALTHTGTCIGGGFTTGGFAAAGGFTGGGLTAGGFTGGGLTAGGFTGGGLTAGGGFAGGGLTT